MVNRRKLLGGVAPFLAGLALPAKADAETWVMSWTDNLGYHRIEYEGGLSPNHTFNREIIQRGDLVIEMTNETVHGDEALDMMGIDRDWFHGLFVLNHGAQ